MATAKVDSNIDPLVESVTCSICMEVLDDPRSLPCMHCYCRRCIQSTMDKHQNKKEFPCPSCRETCPVPDQGAAGLKVNFFANSVLDAIKDRSASSKDDLKCDICLQVDEHLPAVSKCLECNEKLCKSCGRAHKLSRFTKSHNVLELSGDSSRDAKTAIDMLSQRTLYCKIHPKELLKYFCQKDQLLICQDCFAFKHQGHPLEDIEQTAKANLKNLSSVIDLGRQRSAKYQAGIQAGHLRKQAIEKDKEVTKAKLSAARKKEIEEVNAKFDKLEAQAVSDASAQIKNIVTHLANLQFDKDAIDGTVKQLEALQGQGHPSDIVYMIPEINNKREVWSVPTDLDISKPDGVGAQTDSAPKVPAQAINKKDPSSVIVVHQNDELVTKPDGDDAQIDSGPKVSSQTNNINVKGENVKRQKILKDPSSVIIVRQNNDILAIAGGKAKVFDKNLNTKCTMDFPNISGARSKVNDDCFAIWSKERNSLKSISIYSLKDGCLLRKVSLQVPISNPHDFAMNHQSEFVIVTDNMEITFVDSITGEQRRRCRALVPPLKPLPGTYTIRVNSKNDIIMSYNGGILGIRYQFLGNVGFKLFEYVPHWNSIFNMFSHVDSKDNIIVVNQNKNTVELLTPDGVYIKDIPTSSMQDCKVFCAEPNSEGELVVGAYHKDTFQTCIFIVRYRDHDGTLLLTV